MVNERLPFTIVVSRGGLVVAQGSSELFTTACQERRHPLLAFKNCLLEVQFSGCARAGHGKKVVAATVAATVATTVAATSIVERASSNSNLLTEAAAKRCARKARKAEEAQAALATTAYDSEDEGLLRLATLAKGGR